MITPSNPARSDTVAHYRIEARLGEGGKDSGRWQFLRLPVADLDGPFVPRDTELPRRTGRRILLPLPHPDLQVIGINPRSGGLGSPAGIDDSRQESMAACPQQANVDRIVRIGLFRGPVGKVLLDHGELVALGVGPGRVTLNSLLTLERQAK